jgi:flagellar hook-associated protein 2
MSSGLSFGGLASGLDTKSIVEQLMSLERRPIQLLEAKKSVQAGRMTAIQSVKDLIVSLQGAAKGLADRAKMNAKSVTTDTPSTSPSVLTASASADAINGTFKVTVSQLATSTRIASSGPVGKVIDKNAPLATAVFRYALNTGTFRINGQSIAVDATTTLDSLITAINGSGAGVTASLVADADGRPENRVQIVADPGQPLQLGSLSDTSNVLRLLNLSDAVVTGDTVVSSTNLGVTDIGASLADARLVTPIADLTAGNGKFKINDVEISYKDTDSITTIVNRINSSSAGVSAFYDPVQDRLRLTASKTGALTMTLQETAGNGNFLAATGVLSATQQLGQNAVFSIDAVNGGAPLTSATNSVSGYIPGVTLALKSTSATPVTVTVTQDSQATANTVKGFVTQFNNVLQKLEDLTKYDVTNKKASALTGDSGLRNIERQLRQTVSSAAIGATGTYRTLASIGVSFGPIGTAAGTANRLVVDDAKLSAALADNPQAVEAVLAGFAASTGAPTTTNIAAVSGTPQIHQDGTYHIKITDAATGAYEAKFLTPGGQNLWSSTGIMTAGQENSGVIPGLKITAQAAFTQGAEDTFAVTVTNRGVGVALNDFLNGLTDREGYFADRKSNDDLITKNFTDRLAVMQGRLERKEAALQKKYTALEVALSKMQSQSSSVLSQLAGLNASSGQ